MDWNLVLNYLLKILGSAAATLIITFASILFAKLQSKIKEGKIMRYVKEAVKAAEQIYPNLGSKTGPEKLKYVKELILQKYPKLEDNAYLTSLIEGAVYTITNEGKHIVNTTITEINDSDKNNSNTLSSF